MATGEATVGTTPHRRVRRFAAPFVRRTWLTAVIAVAATIGAVALAAQRTPEAWVAITQDWRDSAALLTDLASFEAVIFLKGGLRTAITAFVFSALYVLAVAFVGRIYRALADTVRARTVMQLVLELVTYAIFVVAALAPMSMLMEYGAVRALSADWRATVLMLMINGLFYFIGISYMDHVLTESHKTYATSAEFKSQRRARVIGEASTQFLLSRWASIYYFVLTFTMVPDLIEPGTGFMFRDLLGDNIVKSIFHTVFNDPSAVELLWLQVLAFVATSLLLRLVIDAVVVAYDIRIGLEDGA